MVPPGDPGNLRDIPVDLAPGLRSQIPLWKDGGDLLTSAADRCG